MSSSGTWPRRLLELLFAWQYSPAFFGLFQFLPQGASNEGASSEDRTGFNQHPFPF